MNQQIKAKTDSQNSLKLSKKAYINPQPISAPQQSLDSSPNKSQIQENIRKSSQEPPKQEETLQKDNVDLQTNKKQIYKDHREFLQRYKKQREKQLSAKKLEMQHSKQEKSFQGKRSVSMVEHQHSSLQHKNFVLQRLGEIHQKISQQIVQQPYLKDRPYFKIFTDTVQTKNDIQRVSKQKRFIKSQQSRNYEYNQPSMPAKNRLPVKFRVKTEEIYDSSELSRNAKDFIQKVQKQQENLLGKHLLRKKLEESKRSKEEILQYKKTLDELQSKRQQRKIKAQKNLTIMKEKIKISKMVNRKHFEELIDNTSSHKNMKDYRYSLKGNRNQDSQGLKEKAKMDILNKYKELNKLATDRINNLKESQFKIKEKIAIRKHKLIRPTQYRETSEFNHDQGKKCATEKSDHSSYPQDHFFLKNMPREESQSDEFQEGELPTNKNKTNSQPLPIILNHKAKISNNCPNMKHPDFSYLLSEC